jgi:hypothetical protein
VQGLNCQKISGGLTSAYSLSLSLHTGDSASLTTAGGWNWPHQGIPEHLVWGGGVSKQLRGSTPQTPGNSNTALVWLNRCTIALFVQCNVKKMRQDSRLNSHVETDNVLVSMYLYLYLYLYSYQWDLILSNNFATLLLRMSRVLSIAIYRCRLEINVRSLCFNNEMNGRYKHAAEFIGGW